MNIVGATFGATPAWCGGGEQVLVYGVRVLRQRCLLSCWCAGTEKERDG